MNSQPAFKNHLHALAATLTERGISVIPVPRGEKKPTIRWKEYQTRNATPDEVTRWFGNGPTNMAIICGATSGIVAVDTDSPEAEAWAQEHLPATPWMTRTSHGFHRFYRHPGVEVRNKARIHGRDGIALDVRGDGGYVISPYSLHPSGITYLPGGEWSGPVVDLPAFETAWVPQEECSVPPPQPRAEYSSDGSPRTPFECARAAMEKRDPAIQGQGGDHWTFVTAAYLVNDFNLSDDEAMALLIDWNQRCVPPWTEKDLWKKVSSARKSGTHAPGSALLSQREFARRAGVSHTQVNTWVRTGKIRRSDGGIPESELSNAEVESQRSKVESAPSQSGNFPPVSTPEVETFHGGGGNFPLVYTPITDLMNRVRDDVGLLLEPETVGLLASLSAPEWARTRAEIYGQLPHGQKKLIGDVERAMKQAKRQQRRGASLPDDALDAVIAAEGLVARLRLGPDVIILDGGHYAIERQKESADGGIETIIQPITNWSFKAERLVHHLEEDKVIWDGTLICGPTHKAARFDSAILSDARELRTWLGKQIHCAITSPRHVNHSAEAVKFFNYGASQVTGCTATGYLDRNTFVTPSVCISGGRIVANTEHPCVLEKEPATLYDLAIGTDDDACAGSILLIDKMLRMHAPSVTLPLLAACACAPILTRCKWQSFNLYLEGKFESGKTFTCRAFLNCFADVPILGKGGCIGAVSTGGDTEKTLYALRDVVAVIDDVKLETVNLQHLFRVLQMTYDGSGRGRMTSTQTYYPRGLPIVTGEEIPSNVASSVSRSLIVQVDGATFNLDERDAIEAERHLLRVLMGRYIAWTQRQDHVLLCASEPNLAAPLLPLPRGGAAGRMGRAQPRPRQMDGDREGRLQGDHGGDHAAHRGGGKERSVHGRPGGLHRCQHVRDRKRNADADHRRFSAPWTQRARRGGALGRHHPQNSRPYGVQDHGRTVQPANTGADAGPRGPSGAKERHGFAVHGDTRRGRRVQSLADAWHRPAHARTVCRALQRGSSGGAIVMQGYISGCYKKTAQPCGSCACYNLARTYPYIYTGIEIFFGQDKKEKISLYMRQCAVTLLHSIEWHSEAVSDVTSSSSSCYKMLHGMKWSFR